MKGLEMVKCESLRRNMFRITHTGKSVNFPVTVNHSYAYRPNWTPPGPSIIKNRVVITITLKNLAIVLIIFKIRVLDYRLFHE